MERYFLLGFLGSALALGFAALQRRRVLSVSEGNERMQKIAAAIRAGANAYLKHQYTTVFKVFAIVFLLLLVLAFASGGQMLSRVTPFAFLTGGIFSMLAGFIGMRIATSANARTANAARESLNKGLKVAFSSGSVMGFSVVGLGMLDVTLWFFLLRYGLGYAEPEKIGSVMVMNGMGASFMALFARVGGGIYTKAADVGADLVGKVEAGIPEDDPRNPATIADNVGDNVGDVAGMGADLYESYVGSILATFALGGIAGYGFRGMLLPLLLAVCGILCSILGSFLIRTKENASQEALLRSLRTGTYSAAILAAVLAAPLTKLLIGSWGVYIAILSGLVGGCVIGYFTEYYTSDTYRPTRELAQESETGSATIIIGGLSLGMRSTMVSILVVAAAVLLSFFAAGGAKSFDQGLYGIGIAGVGMLSTLGITLATDAYGPVADNAGGIAQMAELPEEVGLPGEHHCRHRQRLCHRLRLSYRAGAAGELCGHSTGQNRGGAGPVPYQSPDAGGAVYWYAAGLPLLLPHHGRRGTGGPVHCSGGPPPIQGNPGNHGLSGGSGIRQVCCAVHQGGTA